MSQGRLTMTLETNGTVTITNPYKIELVCGETMVWVPESELALAHQHFLENAQHDSWRCTYYPECHCGLWEACDEMGLERIALPPRPEVSAPKPEA